MRKVSTGFVISLLALAALLWTPDTGAAMSAKGPKKRVGVVAFANKTGHRGVGQAAVDVLTTELTKTGQFIVVERAEIEQVLKEQGFGQSGAVNPATAAQAGKILGLQGIIIGTVSEFGRSKVKTHFPLNTVTVGDYATQVVVDVRVIDAETAQILLAESGKGAVKITEAQVLGFGQSTPYDTTVDGEAFRAAIQQVMQNLINQLDEGEWQGRVIKMSGDTALINAGENAGLSIGDELGAYELGEELIDPDTGLSLGMEEGGLKGFCKILSFTNQGKVSKCKVMSGGLERLDIVKVKK
ncbi:MAG: hypothetical protein KDH09_12885 [Chrysiogenetes bacterium]|nr:hypothetical protein [Chrysiogenetes bacterium]